jgi:hypothetical protein
MMIQEKMKIKDLILATFFIAFATINSKAQIRENKVTAQFSSHSEKLTEATGWEQNNETGKWIENKNVIDKRECTSSYWISYVEQNFIWLQFNTITYNSQKYYVLLYEKLGGEYKYPSIQEDWEGDNRMCFFIISPTDYEIIKTQINLKLGKNIKVSSKMSGFISDRYKILGGEYQYNEENLMAKITKAIEQQGYTETCFILNSQVVNGEELVRFRLPENCFSSEENMKTKYFEVKTVDFKKIITE